MQPPDVFPLNPRRESLVGLRRQLVLRARGARAIIVKALSILALIAIAVIFPQVRNIYHELSTGFYVQRFLEGRSPTPGYLTAVLRTSWVCIVSVVLGSIAATIFGFMAYRWRRLFSLSESLVDMARVIPPLVTVPIILTAVGSGGIGSDLLIGFCYSFLSASVYFYGSLRNIPGQYRHLAEVWKTGYLRECIWIKLPLVLREYLDGLRVVTAVTFGIILVSEYFQDAGLGFALRAGQDKASTATIYASILLSVVSLFIMDGALRMIGPGLLILQRIQRSKPWRLTARMSGKFSSLGLRLIRWVIRLPETLIGLSLRTINRVIDWRPMPIGDFIGYSITAIGVLAGLAGFWIVYTQLDDQHIFQAWQTINAAVGKSGDGGRIRALQDLSRAAVHLSGIDLGGAWLADGEISEPRLEHASFAASRLTGVTFEGGQFTGASFKKATLGYVKFSGSKLEATEFAEADISDSRIDRSVLVQADFTRAELRNVELVNTTLNGSIFRAVVGSRVSFAGSILSGSDFSDAYIKNANFQNIRTDQATMFDRAIFDEADFRNSLLTSVRMRSTRCPGARFSGATLSQVDFSGTDLRDTTFDINFDGERADWEGAIRDIRMANIKGIRSAPRGFREWALRRGAVEFKSTEEWNSVRRENGLAPIDVGITDQSGGLR